MKIRALIISGLLLIIVIIILQNTRAVPIQILFWELNIPRIICLLITLVVGFLAGYIWGSGKK